MTETDTPRADIRTVKRFAILNDEKKSLDKQLADVKAQMKSLEPSVIEYFERQGMQSANVEGSTVYLRRELWAGKADDVTNDQMHTAVIGTEWEGAVAPRMNTQTMSAFMREIEAQMKAEGTMPNDLQHVIPEPLRPFLKLNELFKLGVRKS
jgi:hypothetical protein|tara:strand:- start:6621 stop:7076 length:456 start_codon:yes stop_codon:yes gene_type:complete